LFLGGGKLYLSTNPGRIWTVDLNSQIATIIAGDGSRGYNGDGNPALSTTFDVPEGIALDGKGGILVVDAGNNRLRRINSGQIVSTVAGGKVGDGQQATAANLNFFENFAHMAIDATGNLYLADTVDCRIRKVSPAGAISTIVGTGICGYSGDGGSASKATLSFPAAVVLDSKGNMFIADAGNLVIRKVDSAGTISTFVTAFTSSNGSSTAGAASLAIDASDNLYAADGSTTVWKITPSGSTTPAAGMPFNFGYNGDGIPATQALLFFPRGVALDASGNLYIADWLNNRIRKVDTAGIISTVAGNGTGGFSGDGGPATSATLDLPTDVVVGGNGTIYIADWINLRVRVVNSSGTIQTLAGSGGFGYNGEGLPAKQANIFPAGLAARNGTIYILDEGSYRVLKVH
jgi:sugar lactone lactonase YvrE